MRAGRLRAGADDLADAGIPAKPGAWLTTTARRRALDVMRRDHPVAQELPLLVEDDVEPEPQLDDRRSPTTGCG